MTRAPEADPIASAGPPDTEGVIFDIDSFAVHDGPGIRMTVYLKGCPLTCAWCHSPESQRAEPELILARERCLLCGCCVAACPQGLHSIEDGHHSIDRGPCQACGRCVDACAAGAVSIKGYAITAGEVVTKATRMKPFFDHSGGGVTLTGGEVSMQPEFALAVLKGCRAQGIHTAIETCGACDWGTLEELALFSDLVLYDIKLIDDVAHRKWVGASNRGILENAARLTGRDVQIRLPLIPGITDTRENVEGIFSLMMDAGLSRVALLPYNESAGAKYEWLDKCYDLQGSRQSDDELAGLIALATGMGLDATVG